MATEVLRPQDCLTEPIRFNTHRKPYYAGNKTSRKPSKKRVFDESTTAKAGFVFGDVKILKRGETFEVKKSKDANRKQVHLKISNLNLKCRYEEKYAGSVVYCSPSPRTLPLPSFLKKNDGLMTMNMEFGR